MNMDIGAGNFIVVKGYIDSKDERGQAFYGTILALAARRDVKYLSIMFSRDAALKSISWRDLLPRHKDKNAEPDRDPAFLRHEEELFNYLRRGAVLNNVAKNLNTKQAEQVISRYCLDSLNLKAVSLIECSDASDSDIQFFEREGGMPGPSSTGGKREEPETAEQNSGSEGDAEQAEQRREEAQNREEIVIRCDPVLDPVRGVAVNELNIGESVMARLSQDSVFYKLLSNNIPNFDGIIAATVTGIMINELGTANVSLALSDGVIGLMKIAGKVRIKAAHSQAEPKEKVFRAAIELPAGFVFGVAGAIVFIFAIAIVYYILFSM